MNATVSGCDLQINSIKAWKDTVSQIHFRPIFYDKDSCLRSNKMLLARSKKNESKTAHKGTVYWVKGHIKWHEARIQMDFKTQITLIVFSDS